MIWRPKVGMPVDIRYRKTLKDLPHNHGRPGIVVCPASGPGPMNTAVRLDDGQITVVPRGNLFYNKEAS